MKRVNNSNLFIISESEIHFKNKSSRRPRSICPSCNSDRGNPGDPSVAWDLATGVGYCHHCGARFKISSNPDDFENRYGRTEPKGSAVRCTDFREHLIPMEEETLSYLQFRGISKETAMAAGICSRQTWAGASWLHWVGFPFYNGKRLVNVQYKLADIQQKRFMFEPDADLIPWNIDCIYEDLGSEPLYVTEGMIDALALMECGCRYVVSVPNGANSRMGVFDRYRGEIYDKFEYIVFAGDTDEKGLELCSRFTEYFKEKDVCTVTWDDGTERTKDADEMLMLCGRDAVKRCLAEAEKAKSKYIKVFGEGDSGLDSLYDSGIPTGKTIGLQGFDNIVHFEEGNLLLVTGYPGSGKSTLVNYIVMCLLHNYGWKTMFFSPEKQPQKYHEAEMVSVVSGRNFNSHSLTRAELNGAKKFLNGNVLFVDERITDLDRILSLANRAVRAYGIKVLVIDPFVYLDVPAIPGASETQKIAEMLKKLVLATRKLNVFVILVAHPRKPSQDAAPSEPSLYEVSGSANFYNFCDAGIIMERLRSGDNLVRITCGKARRPYNGALGECQLAYDAECGRYVPCVVVNGRYTTEYRAFDRTSWCMPQNPDVIQGSINFGDSMPDDYTDPGEQ